MCGITGILTFSEIGRLYMPNIGAATESLTKRGPDNVGYYTKEQIAMGHRRLSILDTSYHGKQPMKDASERYAIVFNGEIFNYRELREELKVRGYEFTSDSDTEVLLNLYIEHKEQCLQKLNGFFAFAIYDRESESLFIARDRFGIKPFIYYLDDDKFVFASEMKAMKAFKIKRELDYTSLKLYFQLSYIPQPYTCYENIHKLKPGHFAVVKKGEVATQPFYELNYSKSNYTKLNYTQQQERLRELLDQSIERRMISDVPLGAFLSGGIDSSVICSLAAQKTAALKTFSIGYQEEAFFDETKYAELVAKKIGSDHTTFKLSNDDLFGELDDVLNYIDEPFGDSSALPVHILSRLTRKQVTVALSGDGADEVFSGYNKHMGEFRARNAGFAENLIAAGLPLWNALPKSRNFPLSNRVRQFQRFARGQQLSAQERYWLWCRYVDETASDNLFLRNYSQEEQADYEERKAYLLRFFSKNGDFNEVLRTDVDLVLQSDMLTKVDMMSMANSLEVRVPFLDHEVVDFAFSLPVDSKVNKGMKKRIVQDAFRDILPQELYKRPKHGFEVPLLKWFKTGLRSRIENELLSDSFIKDQGLFNLAYVQQLKQKLFSANPEDIHAQIWMLLVFQSWWKKNHSA